jgi:hypothetical protein
LVEIPRRLSILLHPIIYWSIELMAERDARLMLQQIETAMHGLTTLANQKKQWNADERALLCRSISGLTRVVAALVDRTDGDMRCKSSATLKTVHSPE